MSDENKIAVLSEGFNGSISGLEENVIFLVEEIRKITGAKDINIKFAKSSSALITVTSSHFLESK